MELTANSGEVELVQLEPQSVVRIRETARIEDLSTEVGRRIAALSGYLQQGAARPAGPPYVRYHSFGNTETDFELGVPVADAAVAEGPIAYGELPGGPAVTTWHIGPHDRLGEAYSRIGAWLNENGRERSGAAWEVYYWLDSEQDSSLSTLPEPSTWRTQLVQPITAAQRG